MMKHFKVTKFTQITFSPFPSTVHSLPLRHQAAQYCFILCF